MPQLVGSISSYPARATFIWFGGLILVGATALCLPQCQTGRTEVGFLNNLFTATSAACVTGLSVVSTPNDYSLLGQTVILALMQLGGIGIMTITTLIVVQLGGGNAGLRQRALISATLGADTRADVRSILYPVIAYTGLIEFTGFAILMSRNVVSGMPWLQSGWHALFHSVSAFCNAGFALHDDNMTSFRSDVVVNLVICGLIMIGGIGYPVMLDIRRNWRRKSWSDFLDHLQLNTRMMLLGSILLWLGGMICFMIIEWDGALKNKPPGTIFLASFFQSVTCRTAGFNTVNIGRLTNAMLFVMIALMIIGAGPCSTGGGFKVTTFMTLVLQAWSSFRGYARLNVFRRTIPKVAIERAYVTAMLYFVIASLGLTLLLMFEQSDRLKPGRQDHFLSAAFEVVSALGTVGLSTGITPNLSVPGKLIIIALMFVGRLGPISAFAALSRPSQSESIEYSSEEPLLG